MALKLMFCVWSIMSGVSADVFKIDVTLFDSSPLVDTSFSEEYRAYVSWNDRIDTLYNQIGRTGYTGTGAIGTGYDPPDDYGDIGNVPGGSGLPSGTTTKIERAQGKNHRLQVNFPVTSANESVGVYYCTTEIDGTNLTISTIKMAIDAKITPTRYTWTVGIGDSVSLSVNTTLNNTNGLRWMHNNGQILEKWNGQTDVTISNVRFADAGVYECFEDGKREYGEHSIMILFVRACPSTTYGQACLEKCPTCWNGGICEAESGVCICPPGFQGSNCEIPCGSNRWGALCSLVCSSGSGDCRGDLMCPPDPIGCTCVAGYMGLDCNQECPSGKYGANCDRECHCNDTNCDRALGCDSLPCNPGYGGSNCQAPDTCANGYFGEQCNYKCHCYQDGSCNKLDGVCIDGQCATGWAGQDCQQALPVLNDAPSFQSIVENNVTIAWNDWDLSNDYGTGPISNYQLHYGERGMGYSDFLELENTMAVVENLHYETVYEFAVAVVKIVEGNMTAGPIGLNVSVSIACGPPLDSPTISNVASTNPYEITLEWTLPPGEDWKQCSYGLSNFIVDYSKQDDYNKTSLIVPSTEESLSITQLIPCSIYEFYIRAVNKDYEGPNSEPVNGTTGIAAPEEVTMLQIVSLSPTSLNIKWEAATSPCGVPEYIVTYTLENIDQCEENVGQPPVTAKTFSTSLVITNLLSHSTYDISVAASLGNLVGPVNVDSVVTETENPSSPPEGLQADSSKEQRLTFSWEFPPCGERHGVISLFEYQFDESLNGDGSNFTSSTSEIFDKLDHYTYYEFRVAAHTSAGAGPFTDIVRVRTAESVPDAPPQNLQYDNSMREQLEFTWDPPPKENRNGEIISYEYEFEDTGIIGNQTDVVFIELPHYTCYTFRVLARTSVGRGPFSEKISACTLESVPDAPPRNIEFDNSQEQQLEFTWDPPSEENQNGEILSYHYEFQEDTEEFGAQEEGSVNLTAVVFVDLYHSTCYGFRIRASTSVGTGPYSERISACTIQSGTSDSLLIIIVSSAAGFFAVVVVIILIVVVVFRRSKRNDHKQHEYECNIMNAMTHEDIGTESETIRRKGSNGGELNDGYANPDMPQDVSQGTNKDTDRGDYDELDPKDPVENNDVKDTTRNFIYDELDPENPIENNDGKHKRHSTLSDMSNVYGPTDIKITTLANYIRRKKTSDVENFAKEYKALQETNYEVKQEFAVGRSPGGHSYENAQNMKIFSATYVDGFETKDAYISARGPMEGNFNEWWTFLWQENVSTIIMTTSIDEMEKKKYWPNEGETQTYGSVHVKNVEETQCCRDVSMRKLELSKPESDDSRNIIHFQFTKWPKKENPSFIETVVKVHKKVKMSRGSAVALIIVHCSSGAGRSATLIAIDAMLDKSKASNKVNVFGFLQEMRRKRPDMVETLDEYVFIYDTILEGSTCDDTVIEANNLEQNIAIMQKPARLESQFHALTSIVPTPTPELQPKQSENPSVIKIDVESSKSFFIVIDENLSQPTWFWEEVMSSNSDTIVTFGDKHTKKKHSYWPSSGKHPYGDNIIEMKDSKTDSTISETTLKIDNTAKHITRLVTQFEFHAWDDEALLPKSLEGFVEFIERVNSSKTASTDGSNCTFVLSENLHAIGLFCAVFTVLDNMKSTTRVDVYQTVKNIRMIHACMISEKNQYAFIFDCLEQWRKSYASFPGMRTEL